MVPGVPSLTLGFDVVPEFEGPKLTVEEMDTEDTQVAELTKRNSEKPRADVNTPLNFLPDGVSRALEDTQRSMKAAKDGFATCRKDGEPCQHLTASLTVNTVPFEITTKIGPVSSVGAPRPSAQSCDPVLSPRNRSASAA